MPPTRPPALPPARPSNRPPAASVLTTAAARGPNLVPLVVVAEVAVGDGEDPVVVPPGPRRTGPPTALPTVSAVRNVRRTSGPGRRTAGVVEAVVVAAARRGPKDAAKDATKDAGRTAPRRQPLCRRSPACATRRRAGTVSRSSPVASRSSTCPDPADVGPDIRADAQMSLSRAASATAPARLRAPSLSKSSCA